MSTATPNSKTYSKPRRGKRPLQAEAENLIRQTLAARDAARHNLIEFCGYTYPGFIPADHLRRAAQALQAIERGEIKRLMIMMPPRHGKSLLVSRRFPAWYLGRNPKRQVISASYGQELSLDFGRDVRNLLQTQEYRALFPRAELAKDSQAMDRWNTAAGGSYIAAGVGTAITGRGADVFNLDDPIKDRASAESETMRNSVWSWYRSVAYTRLQPGGAIILTLTRWHTDDLAGRLLVEEENGTGDKWVKLILPAIDENNQALWPQFFDPDALKQIRSVIGPDDWEALYMQRPRAPGGSFFSESSLLVEGKPVSTPERYDTVYATIDTAVKTGKEHDGLGCVYWARSRTMDPPLVILDWELRQMEGALLDVWLPTVFQNLEIWAGKIQARMGSAGAHIEDKASGMVLLQQAARKGWPAYPIDSRLTSVGKSERAISISGHVHAGRVKFSETAYNRVSMYKGRNRNHLLAQILDFRAGTKDMGEDDLLDSFSFGIALGLDSPKVNNL